ncbi:MAG: hypothetical protein EOO69_10575 [Moraxellaceae bacterium]|nr:MAG: hypothetical protein EOO69_10575 [Moraxellaceae bacterium]
MAGLQRNNCGGLILVIEQPCCLGKIQIFFGIIGQMRLFFIFSLIFRKTLKSDMLENLDRPEA